MTMTHTPSAIVMAAGQGIGAGIARHLHSVGYRLVLLANDVGAQTLAAELGVVGLKGSVTSVEDIEVAVRTAVESFGRIDLVVNNTGHAAIGELLAISDDDWHGGLDLILLNVIRMARAVTPVMERQGGGTIVNISSYSVGQPFPISSVSEAMRNALAAWMKMYADTYGPKGIRMNNVLPGWFDNTAGRAGDRFIGNIPLRRLGLMSELGGLIAFLASPAGAYITGQNLRVDGGLARPMAAIPLT